MSLIFTIPMPPSVNSIWRQGKRKVYRNPQYKAWMHSAAWTIRFYSCLHDPLSGDTFIEMKFGPRNKKADLDNLLKATIDALVQGGAIKDDRYVKKLTAEWADVQGCHIRVSAI